MWDIKTVGNKALFGAKWIGISAALGYGVLQYAKHKWIQVIKEKGMIMAAQSHLKTRFELNIKDIEFTAENQILALKDQVFAEFNVEELTAKLRNQSTNGLTNDQVKENKIKLWNQIKVFAFTRMILGIYLLVLHTEFTAVLISIFGRLDYLDSLDRQSRTTLEDIFDDDGLPVKDPSHLFLSEPSISDDTRRRFLTVSWYILHIGWKNISGTVYDAVQMIILDIPLNRELDYDDFKMLVTDIKIIIESNLSKFWFLIRYQDVFLPPEGEENSIFEANGFPPGDNPLLYELIKETRDIVECEDFYLIHKNDLDSTFQTLLADILTHFDSKKEIDSSLAPSKSIPLAGLLPIIADGTRSIFSVNSNKFLNVCRFNRILRTALTSNHLTL